MKPTRALLGAYVLSVACGHAAPITAPAASVPTSTRVRACGLAADDRVTVHVGTSTRTIAVEAEPTGCIRFLADPHSRTALDVRGPAGRALLFVAPVAGTIEVVASHAPALGLEVVSRDAASRVAIVLTTYALDLRLAADSDAPARAARLHDAAPEADAERDAWGVVEYVLARTPNATPTEAALTRARAFVRSLSADHWAWSVEWEAVVLAAVQGDVADEFVVRVASRHPDPDVRAAAALALGQVGQRRGDLSLVRDAVTRLRDDQAAAASVFARIALTYDPDRGLREGESLPVLLLADAERPDVAVDLAALRGRVVVLHFWSTWCRACHEGVAALERLFAAHRGDDLAIISVAFDEDWSAVTRFRAEHSAMPWQHARLRAEDAAALSARFEITGSTKTIVIGRDGKVRAENRHPSQDDFEAVVADALAAAK